MVGLLSRRVGTAPGAIRDSSRRVGRVFEAHQLRQGGVVGLEDSTHPTRPEDRSPRKRVADAALHLPLVSTPYMGMPSATLRNEDVRAPRDGDRDQFVRSVFHPCFIRGSIPLPTPISAPALS